MAQMVEICQVEPICGYPAIKPVRRQMYISLATSWEIFSLGRFNDDC
jgi:hypothetical protein